MGQDWVIGTPNEKRHSGLEVPSPRLHRPLGPVDRLTARLSMRTGGIQRKRQTSRGARAHSYGVTRRSELKLLAGNVILSRNDGAESEALSAVERRGVAQRSTRERALEPYGSTTERKPPITGRVDKQLNRGEPGWSFRLSVSSEVADVFRMSSLFTDSVQCHSGRDFRKHRKQLRRNQTVDGITLRIASEFGGAEIRGTRDCSSLTNSLTAVIQFGKRSLASKISYSVHALLAR